MFVKAHTVKVFSKYNHYTIEKDVTIIAELSSDLDRSEHLLSFFGAADKPIAKEDLQKNDQLSIKIPTAAFDPGKIELQYTISHKNKTVQRGSIAIIRLRPKANEVKNGSISGSNHDMSGSLLTHLVKYRMAFYSGNRVMDFIDEGMVK